MLISISRRLQRGSARRDEGNVLITVVLVSMVVGMLASVLIRSAENANVASASDRNHEIALGVAEAGAHEAITRIENALAAGYVSNVGEFTGSTDQGTFRVLAQRAGSGFAIDAYATVGTAGSLSRGRHVRFMLEPPELFPDAGYALFSSTNLYLKNNNEIYDGDIWSNDSLWIEGGAKIHGSVTSAQSWVRIEQNGIIDGYVWAGGRKCVTEGPTGCTDGWGVNQTSGTVHKWVKSSVSAPDCTGQDPAAYKAIIGGTVMEDVTVMAGATIQRGDIRGEEHYQCTVGPAAKAAPTYVFNPNNYNPATFVQCPSASCPDPTPTNGVSDGAAAFTNWLTTARKANFSGTFAITECGGGKIMLTGTKITGDVTIITNPVACPGGIMTGARVNTDGIDDTGAPEGTDLVIVSHYSPPAGTICTDQNDDQCAIVAKNHFRPSCETAALLYADNGPVAVKNNFGGGGNDQRSCGSVIAAGIHMKNNLQLQYDSAFERVVGFGATTYEIARWEELPLD